MLYQQIHKLKKWERPIKKGVNKYDTILHLHTLGITKKEKSPVNSDNLAKELDHR